MDFTLTETQSMLADTVTGLVTDHYDFETRRSVVASGLGRSPAFWAQLAELGLLGVEIDEAHGGSGGSFEDVAAMLQPLGRALVIDPIVPTVVLGAGLVSRLGTEAQKTLLLASVVEGTSRLALAHGEDGDGRPSGSLLTVAAPQGGGWRLSGRKTFIWGGDGAAVLIVSAETPAGTSLFLVPTDAQGVSVRAYPLYDGGVAADVTLIDVDLGFDALLGVDGEAGSAIDWALDRGAAAVMNEAVGAMSALCDITLDYIKSRVQFGKPIGTFQVLQHRMVNMRIALEQARSMAMLASVAADDADAEKRAQSISAAKAVVGKAAREVGQSAVQLHGGIALTDEYSAGHYFKRLTIIDRLFGDTSFHLSRFAQASKRRGTSAYV